MADYNAPSSSAPGNIDDQGAVVLPGYDGERCLGSACEIYRDYRNRLVGELGQPAIDDGQVGEALRAFFELCSADPDGGGTLGLRNDDGHVIRIGRCSMLSKLAGEVVEGDNQ